MKNKRGPNFAHKKLTRFSSEEEGLDQISLTKRRLIAAKRNWDKTSNKKEWEQNIKSSRKFGVTLLVNQRVPSQTLFYL